MTMRRTHDVTLTVGEYEKDGQGKKERVKIGSMMTDDQSGNMSICLKVPPSFKTSEKTGYPEAWLSLFPIENKQQQAQPQYGGQPQAPQYQNPPQQQTGVDPQFAPPQQPVQGYQQPQQPSQTIQQPVNMQSGQDGIPY